MGRNIVEIQLVRIRAWRPLVSLLALAIVAGVGVPLIVNPQSADGAELPSVAGLLSRWRAADLSLMDGAPVSNWADSVSGVAVSQSNPARQPLYKASVASLGGRPAVSFARSAGQWLTASAAARTVPPDYLAGTSGATVFVVMTTPASVNAAMTTWFASTGSSGSSARAFTQVTSGGQAGVAARRLDTDALVSVNSPASAVAAGTPYILTGLLDFAGNQGRQYVNGQWAIAKSLSGAGAVSPTGSQRVAIGVNGSDANAMDGSIAEILVYRNALSPAERAVVHSYLQDTYGIAVADYLGSTPSTTATAPATSTTTAGSTTTTTSASPPSTSPSSSTSATSTTTSSTPTGPAAAKVTLPTSVAPPAALPASTTTTILVKATDASGAPLAGALVYLKLQVTAGGGAADVGGAPLTSSYQPFLVDGSGQLVVYYTTPPVLPGGGRDVLTVANLKSSPTSTDTAAYAFTTTQHWRWAPEPISAPGSMLPGASVPLTVTALDAAWLPVPNAQVCLSLSAAPGGGSATGEGVALTSKYQCFGADASGTAHLSYRAPDTLPSTGLDQLNVRDTTSSLYNTSSFHGYSFGQLTQVTLSPTPISAPGTLAPGAKVTITVTPRDTTGAQVAGADVQLWLETASGARATVSNSAAAPDGTTLGSSPKSFLTHTTTKLTISYQTGKTLPASGADRIYAQVTSADGTVVTLTTADYSWGGA